MNGPDFIINPAGMSLVILVPWSDKAKAWAKENIDIPDYASERSIPVEPRYIGAIVDGIKNDGMTVS